MRFSGFNKEWNQYYLKDVIQDFINGQTPSRNVDSFWNGDVNWVSSGELNYNYITSTIEQITAEGKNNANLKLLSPGTFLIAITGLEAPGTRGSCAILGIEATTNQSCMALLPKEDKIITKFLYYWYLKVGETYGIKYTQGTKQQSYNKELLEKLPITIPDIREQNKISEFLSVLNHKIELLEQKYQYYQNFKKYLMQQIFTQKLRFADSDSCWKEISLKDIGTFYRGHSYNSTNVADEGLLVLRSNNIQGNVLDFSEDGLQFVDKDCKKELELQKNDIVICMSNGTRRLVGKSAEYTGNYENKVTVGAFCSIFRTKNKLAKYLFQTESYKKNLYLILAGTNINNLKNSDLEKFKFNIPTNESEINKIHDLFVSIDNKIDYNKKQLEEITLFKKGLLQQMFV